MSCLRAICNSLIDDGKMKLADYPFRQIKLSYQDSNRGFLTTEQIQKFEKVKLKEGSTIKKSQDIFLFCL